MPLPAPGTSEGANRPTARLLRHAMGDIDGHGGPRGWGRRALGRITATRRNWTPRPSPCAGGRRCPGSCFHVCSTSTGLVHEAILEDFPDLSEHQVYACGSVAMVEAAHPAFVSRGMSEHDCFFDAFKLAPQIRSGVGDLVKLGGGR